MALQTFRLPSATRIGAVHLRISNLEKSLAFYGGLLGLNTVSPENSTIGLSASGESPELLRLTEVPGAKPRTPHSAGLFHTAIRVPSRVELANVIRQLQSSRWPLYGFANHGVSESVYLADPDGNGIEIYADLPREAWPHDGDRIAMTTDPLDVDKLLKLAEPEWHGLARNTVVGHVHLQVSDLKKAKEFYHELLGFDVTQESYPGALFLSAGGYHHHVAVNVWSSRGGSPASADSIGLQAFEIIVPDANTLSALRNRMDAAGVTTDSVQEKNRQGIAVYDPDHIRVEILVPSS
jgi:catechol 2,3-dioxygenase